MTAKFLVAYDGNPSSERARNLPSTKQATSRRRLS